MFEQALLFIKSRARAERAECFEILVDQDFKTADRERAVCKVAVNLYACQVLLEANDISRIQPQLFQGLQKECSDRVCSIKNKIISQASASGLKKELGGREHYRTANYLAHNNRIMLGIVEYTVCKCEPAAGAGAGQGAQPQSGSFSAQDAQAAKSAASTSADDCAGEKPKKRNVTSLEHLVKNILVNFPPDRITVEDGRDFLLRLKLEYGHDEFFFNVYYDGENKVSKVTQTRYDDRALQIYHMLYFALLRRDLINNFRCEDKFTKEQESFYEKLSQSFYQTLNMYLRPVDIFPDHITVLAMLRFEMIEFNVYFSKTGQPSKFNFSQRSHPIGISDELREQVNNLLTAVISQYRG